jgi:hypothetical protein
MITIRDDNEWLLVYLDRSIEDRLVMSGFGFRIMHEPKVTVILWDAPNGYPEVVRLNPSHVLKVDYDKVNQRVDRCIAYDKSNRLYLYDMLEYERANRS